MEKLERAWMVFPINTVVEYFNQEAELNFGCIAFLIDLSSHSFYFHWVSLFQILFQEGVNVLAVSYGAPGACPYPRHLKLVSHFYFWQLLLYLIIIELSSTFKTFQLVVVYFLLLLLLFFGTHTVDFLKRQGQYLLF